MEVYFRVSPRPIDGIIGKYIIRLKKITIPIALCRTFQAPARTIDDINSIHKVTSGD